MKSLITVKHKYKSRNSIICLKNPDYKESGEYLYVHGWSPGIFLASSQKARELS